MTGIEQPKLSRKVCLGLFQGALRGTAYPDWIKVMHEAEETCKRSRNLEGRFQYAIASEILDREHDPVINDQPLFLSTT